MNRRGFSLMEMMVVLLIVAIVAAASAPMVSKKLSGASSATGMGCYWKSFENEDKDSITYNSVAKPYKSVIIGAKKTDLQAGSTEKPRLFIKSNSNSNPHIRLLSHNITDGDINADIAVTSKKAYWFSSGDSSQAGPNSVVIGHDATVGTSIGAIAIGGEAVVSSSGGSVAIGSSFSAGSFSGSGAQAGQTSVAIGSSSNAKNYAVAVGYGAEATEDYSTAVGNIAKATDLYSTAFGRNARALNERSTAVGSNSTANSPNSSAFGYNATASNENAIAIGSATASALDAIAIGSGATAEQAQGGVSVGSDAYASGTYAVALGTSAHANGDYTIAIGGGYEETKASAGDDYSIAIGGGAKATVTYTTALGYSSVASGEHSTALGSGAHVSAGSSAVAIGSGAGAYGDNAIAIGTVSAGANEVKLGTNSHKVYLGGCTFQNGEAYIDTLRVNTLYVDDFASIDTLKTAAIETGSLDVSGDTKTYNLIVPGAIATNTIFVNDTLISWKTNGLIGSDATDGYDKALNGAKYGDGTNNDKHERSEVKNMSASKLWSSYGYSFHSNCDRRLKNVGEAFTAGLEEIKKLEVFNYVYKKDTTKTPRVGVMAQDLMKIFPNAVFKGDDGFYRIRMEDMFYALVNAVKELDKKIDLLAEKQKEIETLRAEVKSLKKDYADLEKRIEKLEKRK